VFIALWFFLLEKLSPMHPDILGQALLDYLNGDSTAELTLYTSYGETESMPASIFFRGPDDMPPLEQYALHVCSGKVLDAGAGAGSHSLILQQRKLAVTALDISPLCAEVMRRRGVQRVICADIFKVESTSFDTVLLLMNGLGLAGNRENLPVLLRRLKKLLRKQGQILVDSCDISYLTEELPAENQVTGEITYQFAYKGNRGLPFTWLYLEYPQLATAAQKAGLMSQLIYAEETGQYLARLINR
jgi:SAM-dependent methyltransferase